MKEVIKYIPSLISFVVSIAILHQFYIKALIEFAKIQTWSGTILYIFASFVLFSGATIILFIINWVIYDLANQDKIKW